MATQVPLLSQNNQTPPSAKAEKKTQSAQETQVENNENAQQSSLEDQFSKLLLRYQGTLTMMAQFGSNAQSYIDAEYALLSGFVADHPEFRSQMPEKRSTHRRTASA